MKQKQNRYDGSRTSYNLNSRKMHLGTGMVTHRDVQRKWVSVNSLWVVHSDVKSIVVVRTFASLSFAPCSYPSRSHTSCPKVSIPSLDSNTPSSTPLLNLRFQLLWGLRFFRINQFLLLNSPLTLSASLSQPAFWLTVTWRSCSSLQISKWHKTLELDFFVQTNIAGPAIENPSYLGPEASISVFQPA